MSNVGQAVLTIGGAVVGSFFGAPQLGYLLGSLAGSALFPTQLPTVKGPRLEDLKGQTSTLGAPIPWVWGTFILAGEMIWRSPFIEHKIKEKSGGKGGPEQTSIHYQYSANFAIGLCKGEIIGIRRIWADTKLIYDATRPADLTDDVALELSSDQSFLTGVLSSLASSTATEQKFDLYLGTETQIADPTIETWEGVGNAPGYRGLSYIVFRDFDLTEYGNRIPNFRVEVMTAGTVGDIAAEIYSNDVLFPWQYQIDPSVQDPRNPDNEHVYGYTENGGTATESFEDAFAEMNSVTDHPDQPFICGEVPQVGDSAYIHGWSHSITPNDIRPCDSGQALADYVSVQMTLNAVRISPDYCSDEITDSTCAAWWAFLGGKGNPKYVSAGQFSGVVVATDHDTDPAPYFGGIPFTASDSSRVLSACNVGGNVFDVWRLQSHEFGVARSLVPPDPCSIGTPIPGAPGYCATADGEVVPSVTWVRTVGTWHVLRSYDDTGGANAVVTAYPLNPARPSTHAQYNDQAFWEDAYAEAVADGDIEAGLVYGVDYPEAQAYGWVGSFSGTVADPDPIPLSEIVADICEGCGLTSYNVTDLETTLVNGYALTGPVTGKAGIDVLRPFGYFDAVESEFEYKFVNRGHDAVATIDTDDLSARLHTEDRPPAVSVVRAQDKELPRLVRAHFIDLARDGDPGQAEQQRQTVDSVNAADLQVPVVMSQERGQSMVDTVLFERWIGRNSYEFSLPFKYASLEPTDCVNLTVDGTDERLRITSVDLSAMAVLKFSAIRDDASVYSGLDIVGVSTTHEPIPIGNVPSPTEMLLLELPALRAQDTDCGYYAATRGLLAGWPGAIVYRATSASGTFRQVAWTSIAATIGIVTETPVTETGNSGTGTGQGTGVSDEFTVLRVKLYSGSFESVSAADLLAGENLLAVGQEGDWELIRFQVAELGTDGVYELSSLIRAQYGTTQRDIVAGDRTVLMSGPGIMRIDESETAGNVERVLRAVTSGTSLEDAEDHFITTTCLSTPDEEGSGASSGCGGSNPTIVSTGLTTTPTEATGTRYHPYHWGWLLAGNRSTAKMDAMLADAPSLQGFVAIFYLDEVNPTGVTYDFTEILASLSHLAGLGKYFSVMLAAKTFSSDSSHGANRMPADLQDYAIANNASSGGYTPLWWNATVDARFDDVYTALEAAVAGSGDSAYFEGITTQETSLGLDNNVLYGDSLSISSATTANPAVFTSTAHGLKDNQDAELTAASGGTWSGLIGTTGKVTVLTDDTFSIAGVDGTGRGTLTSGTVETADTGYTPSNFAQVYIDRANWMIANMPDRRMFWTTNFISGGQSQIDRVINETKTLGNVVLNGPDILKVSTSLNSNFYPKYETYKDSLPLACVMSPDSYSNGQSAATQWAFARDELHLNYCFWCGVTGSSFDFDPEGAAVIEGDPAFNDESALWGVGGGAGAQGTYYVPTGATGEWADHIGEFACYSDGAWHYSSVIIGFHYWDESTQQYVTLDGEGGWSPVTSGGGASSIQFKDEGSDIGTPGTVTAVDFVGAGVTASFVGATVTVTIPGATTVSTFPPQLGHAGV